MARVEAIPVDLVSIGFKYCATQRYNLMCRKEYYFYHFYGIYEFGIFNTRIQLPRPLLGGWVGGFLKSLG